MDLLANLSIGQAGIELSVPRRYMQLQPHQQALLKQPAPMFLLCENIAISEADLIFTYQKTEKHLPFSQIRNCTTLEKYLILIRIGRFIVDPKKRCSTSFDPRNIFFTQTLDVAFLLRIYPGTIPELRTPLDEFNDFKALVLSVIQDKHTFEQLVQCGLEIVEPSSLAQAVINAQNPQELEQILTDKYERDHYRERQNRIGLSKKFVAAVFVVLCLLLTTTGVSAFLAYDNVTRNRINTFKNAIYQSYYDNNKGAIVESANALKDKDMDPRLSIIVADALIASKEPENLHRAFNLDPSRRLEIIDKLILLQKYDLIATLVSDDSLIQAYQAYYAKDYSKVIALVDNSTGLKQDSRAQLLLAKACAALSNYTRAEAVLIDLSKSSSLDSYLETSKKNRETARNEKTDLENREMNVQNWDDIIKLIEDIQKNKAK